MRRRVSQEAAAQYAQAARNPPPAEAGAPTMDELAEDATQRGAVLRAFAAAKAAAAADDADACLAHCQALLAEVRSCRNASPLRTG